MSLISDMLCYLRGTNSTYPEVVSKSDSPPSLEVQPLFPKFSFVDYDKETGKIRLKINFEPLEPNNKKIIENYYFQIFKDIDIGWKLGGTKGIVCSIYKSQKAWASLVFGSTIHSLLKQINAIAKSTLTCVVDIENFSPRSIEVITKSQEIIRALATWALVNISSTLDSLFEFINGPSKSILVHADIPKVTFTSFEIERIQKIVQALIKKSDETSIDQDFEIHCPISQEVMIFPVTTSCGHVFETTNFLQLDKLNHCPTCNAEINTSQLEWNDKKTNSINNLALKSFEQMETILRNLPRGNRDLVLSASKNKGIFRVFAEKEKNEGFLLPNESSVLEKIEKGTLSCEEAYIVAYYLVKLFKPMNKKIKCIVLSSMRKLDELFSLENKIDQITLAKYSLAIYQCFPPANPIATQQFPILHSLFRA